MDKRDWAIKIAKLTIEKNGNPSIQDFVNIGATEGQAVEWVMRMSTKSSESLVAGAHILLEQYGEEV